MTLQPYDGANWVQLPNGTVCWEKETEHFGGSETTLSYQYSVEIPKDMLLDYWGRVVGIKVQAKDGSWNKPVNFMPVTCGLIADVRNIFERGWAKHHEGEAEGLHSAVHRLYADDYLDICDDVMALLKAVKK